MKYQIREFQRCQIGGDGLELLLRVDPTAATPLYQQVVEQVREAILHGRLRPGEELPSSRELAVVYGIARNTVVAAYQQLVSEGYLEGRERSGHYVNAQLPDDALHAERGGASTGLPASVEPAGQIRLSHWGEAVAGLDMPVSDERLPFDFRQQFPPAGAFPLAEWRRQLAHTLEAEPDLLGYADPAGDRSLREAIATHVARTRGVVCGADQVVITTGARQAFDLIGRTLLNPGDGVAIEEPGYPAVRQAFTALGARVHPIPVDGHGLQTEQLANLPPVRLIHVTPSHQYPTGVTLDLARRLALLEWARRHGALVVEDDYDGEFRHAGRPLQSLQGLDGGLTVIYVGTFSKSLAPGLRLGFMILPRPFVGPAIQAKWVMDRQTATLPQKALAAFAAHGGLERHLRRMRMLVRQRRKVFLGAVAALLPGVTIWGADAGMHVMIDLPEIRSAEAAQDLVAAARESGVGLQSAAPCYMGPPPPGHFLFWYAHLQERAIREGIRLLSGRFPCR